MSRKATVQLTFTFTKDFSDAEIHEHVELLLQHGIVNINERIMEELCKTPKSAHEVMCRKAALKMLREDRVRYRDAQKTLKLVQIEG